MVWSPITPVYVDRCGSIRPVERHSPPIVDHGLRGCYCAVPQEFHIHHVMDNLY
jgi:hypothetical protein